MLTNRNMIIAGNLLYYIFDEGSLTWDTNSISLSADAAGTAVFPAFFVFTSVFSHIDFRTKY